MLLRLFGFLLIASGLVWGQTPQPPKTSSEAEAALTEGIKLFQAAEYEAAVEAFRRAQALGSPSSKAVAYEAYAEMMQWIPGEESPENRAHSETAERLFKQCLERDPDSLFETRALASLYFNQKEFDEAKRLHRRVIELDPNAAESYYTIGVICWQQCYQPRLEARAEIGMEPGDPGPMTDPIAREALAKKIRPSIDEGLKALEEAIAINPDYADAMAYMNLLYRERADLAVDSVGYEQDMAAADYWVGKTLETKKAVADATPISDFEVQ